MAMERINGQDNRKTAYYQSAGNEKTQEKQEGTAGKQENGGGTIYAGDLELGQNDLLAKKDQLKKSAIKVLLEAFTGEQKIDESVDEHQSNVEALEQEADQATGEMNRIRDLKQELKEICRIKDDSEEQKDLELLEKKKDYESGFSDTPLTEEEKERINNMGPLTEYQQAALEYHDMEFTWRKRLDTANDTITMEHKTIEAIQLARLKIHPIVDASKDSQKILDAASKEFIGGLLEEGKDNIDDKIGDDSDKAEEIKEKEEEKQEETAKTDNKEEAEKKAKKYKEIAKLAQPRLEDIDWEKVQRDIKAIIDKEKLLSEDLKGLTVDEEL